MIHLTAWAASPGPVLRGRVSTWPGYRRLGCQGPVTCGHCHPPLRRPQHQEPHAGLAPRQGCVPGCTHFQTPVLLAGWLVTQPLRTPGSLACFSLGPSLACPLARGVCIPGEQEKLLCLLFGSEPNTSSSGEPGSYRADPSLRSLKSAGSASRWSSLSWVSHEDHVFTFCEPASRVFLRA